MVRPGTIIVQA